MNRMVHIEGLQLIPIGLDKIPTVREWQTLKVQHDLSKAKGIGLVCGQLSEGVEAIDIDLKYDLTGTLFERFKQAIKEADKTILPKLTVQRTKSGGYHFLYRCSKIAGNKKLAQRHTTEDEKKQSAQKAYDAEILRSKDEAKAKQIAEKTYQSDKVRVLIETRGEGGYVAVFPTPGYELVYGQFSSIQELTPEQRDTIFEVAQSLNEYYEEYKPEKRESKEKQEGLTPFDDYNQRGDVIGLLESHGWQSVGKKAGRILLKRPGNTTAKHSGNFDQDKNWFTVFTTSTEFEPQKAYLPYSVYAILECKGDFAEAVKKLYADGYGDRTEPKKKETEQPTVKSKIDLSDGDLSFVAKRQHYMDYLERLRNGTFEMGKSTGIATLDNHFLFKAGNLVVINGHDNVGKSTVIWFIAMMSALCHGWKWIIFSSENTVGGFYRKMIEFYFCEQITNLTAEQYSEALAFVEKHFTVIVSDEDLFNYRDIINMAKKIMETEKHHGLLIDPYNSLKVDLSSASKLNTHEYHYEALSEIKLYGKKANLAFYINCHAVTNALRMRDSDGHPVAPGKADTEQGGKFANKADEFITIHRKVQHREEWNVSEIHVRKVKETETGGKTTPFEEPVKLRMTRNMCGFEEQLKNGTWRNVIFEWQEQQKNFRRAIENNEPRPNQIRTVTKNEFESDFTQIEQAPF